MASIHVNGCNFHCQTHGTGRDIVFIHGEIHGLEYWEHQVGAFSADHRCFTYNRRGHAGTGWTDYGFSLVNQTRDLEQLIEKQGIEDPIIVAVAFGTTIAANYAIQNPGKVRGLVLVAWSEMHDALQYFARWRAYSVTVAEILERDGREGLVRYLREHGGKSIYRVIPVDSPVREKVIQMFASHPIDEYRRGMLEFGLSVPDLLPAFRQLDLPVVGICGDQDPYPDQPEVLSGMKNFKEHPPLAGAGRFVQWEKPEAFNEVVRQFLRRLS
jgi:pimeloyl-ACP methyl ester carboxylesterase